MANWCNSAASCRTAIESLKVIIAAQARRPQRRPFIDGFPSNSRRAAAAATEGGGQLGNATPDNLAHSAINRSCNSADAVCGSGAR